MEKGCVYLVGAGPGDPNLITVKGLQCLVQADVILYDGLANPDLLKHARKGCQCINVEKRPGLHRVQQDEINNLMVDHAKVGRCVVRLKGGDPIVFGRGGEEAEVLYRARIPFEIVPGITSAIAAPAYAGIPVTNRGMSTHVTIVTGTTATLDGSAGVDWEGLARAGGTLLILMGTRHRAEIAKRLINGGRLAETPVSIVQNGTLSTQKTVRTTLEKLGEVVISNPAVIVVGAVASMDLNWFESKPLFGRTIAVTRARTQASNLATAFANLGATVLEVPTLEFADPDSWDSVDAAIGHIHTFDWVVFTSANGVERFLMRIFELGLDVRVFHGVKLATIGKATTEKVETYHLTVALEAKQRVSEGLVCAFEEAGQVIGKRFLIPKPEISRDVLPKKLRELGGTVEEVVVYRTVKPTQLPGHFLDAINANQIDLLTFTSSATVHNLVSLLSPDHLEQIKKNAKVACMGPITAESANTHGFQVVAQLEENDISIESLIEAVKTFFS